jgi:hypothetical protein
MEKFRAGGRRAGNHTSLPLVGLVRAAGARLRSALAAGAAAAGAAAVSGALAPPCPACSAAPLLPPASAPSLRMHTTRASAQSRAACSTSAALPLQNPGTESRAHQMEHDEAGKIATHFAGGASGISASSSSSVPHPAS